MENDRILFGQYIKKFSKFKNRLDGEEVEKAIEIQREKNGDHRKVGEILLDMNVFISKRELQQALEDFEEFKAKYI